MAIQAETQAVIQAVTIGIETDINRNLYEDVLTSNTKATFIRLLQVFKYVEGKMWKEAKFAMQAMDWLLIIWNLYFKVLEKSWSNYLYNWGHLLQWKENYYF